MEAYLNGHATTIRSEGQALRAVTLVVDYLKAVKQVSAPLSFWTPSRQLDFAGWLHRTHQHGAATIERVINVLGAAMNDAAAVKMRLDAIGQPVEGAIVSHVPKIVYQGERIAKELKLPRSQIAIAGGATARLKTVALQGEKAALLARLEERFAAR